MFAGASLKEKLFLYNAVLALFFLVSGGTGYVGSKKAYQKYEQVLSIESSIAGHLTRMENSKGKILRTSSDEREHYVILVKYLLDKKKGTDCR